MSILAYIAAMSMSNSTCLFLGTSAFSIPSAEALLASGVCTLLGVVTQPDKPAGRGQQLATSPMAAWARERRIPLWQPATKQELTALVRECAPDVAVVVAYGRIIAADALAIPPHGFVNLHPSLLPRWRGPSPIAAAIAAGDQETGVTVMRIDDQMDHGPILAQERTPLLPHVTRTQLEQDLAKQGATLLARTLSAHLAGDIIPKPQDDAQTTVCPLLSKEDGRILWNESALVIERKIRAYEGWPGTWMELPNGKRLKILTVEIEGTTDANPGTIARDAHGRMVVACGEKKTFVLLQVQPEGKQPMDGASFLRGYNGPMQCN
ncbi:MAG: methionyl-tRNA formyltransferase [bacterium]|nr:methionyl-tRNA formyltransferase [bacterium]